MQKPESASRPLYAGRRLPNNQVSGKLVPENRNASGFDDNSVVYDASSVGSLSFVSRMRTGPGYPPELAPNAHDRAS